MSTLYAAVEGSQLVGVCSVFHAFSRPSIVLAASTTGIKNALLKSALKEVSDDFISLCQPDETEIFENYSTILQARFEQQMVANSLKQIKNSNIKVSQVRKVELENLDKFYREQKSEAWTKVQFRVGPFFCVKQDDKIVSAAGTQLKTPQIAHIGNIVTDEAYRNRGFATVCTSTLAADLSSKGRVVSLFVRTENKPAIKIYEKIGFKRIRDVVSITAKKVKNQKDKL
jgi:ribosomal protein S18 acetylase RimI-like enzyme